MSKVVDLSVVLPSYRNAGLAVRSVRELGSFLQQQALSWEIVVVDDGGHDFTELPQVDGGDVFLIRLPENRGKGAAVRAGMLAAIGRCRVFTDIDLPFDLSLLPLIALYVLDHGYHLVVGDRTLPGSRYALDVGWKRRIASAVFAQFTSKIVTGGFYDTQCGLKGFRGDVAQALFSRAIIDRFAFDVELLYLALKHRLDIKRVPVQLRNNDASSVRLVRDSSRMLMDVFRIKAHQMTGHYHDQELDELLARDLAKAAKAANARFASVSLDAQKATRLSVRPK